MRKQPAYGMKFSDGVGGARSNGKGLILEEHSVRIAALDRALVQVREANTEPLPSRGTTATVAPGVHAVGWDEFVRRVSGTSQRDMLVGQLETIRPILRNYHVPAFAVGGSILTDALHPRDLDVAYISDGFSDPSSIKGIARGSFGGMARARDVQLLDAIGLLVEAPRISAVPGSNMLEFLQGSYATKARRGVVLLSTDVALDSLAPEHQRTRTIDDAVVGLLKRAQRMGHVPLRV